jgi:hypothetical protein
MLDAQTATPPAETRPRADAGGDVQRLTELRDQWRELDQKYMDLEEQLSNLDDEILQVKDAGRQIYDSMDGETADRIFDELSPDNWE